MIREVVTDQEREFFYARKKLPKLYTDYLDYCRKIKNLAIGTIQNRKRHVLSFILEHPNKASASKVNKITQEEIQEYVVKAATNLSREMKRSLVVSLRDFFRFLHLKEYTELDLSHSVPTITTYRMSRIPRTMPWETVELILKTINKKTLSGKRDYAIILVFARYGIRACQLRELRLKDIDWDKKTIRFLAIKGGNEITSPLFDDVAKAILAYFKAGRMKASDKYDHVFLTSGEWGSKVMGQVPLRESTWNIVSRALKKAKQQGLINHAQGPHAIRHAFATKLLDKDTPLKNISDMLGHRSLETTFIYTKTSLKQMRKLTLRWPGSSL